MGYIVTIGTALCSMKEAIDYCVGVSMFHTTLLTKADI